MIKFLIGLFIGFIFGSLIAAVVTQEEELRRRNKRTGDHENYF